MKINREKKRYCVLIGAALICTILVIWMMWGNTALMMSEISISSDRLPASFSGFCIAQVSDLHNAEFGEDIDANHTDVNVALTFTQKSGLESAGVTVLENEITYLEREEETITLLGLADPDFTIGG